MKEEVRLRKERVTEQRAAEADIRKERVDVEGDQGARRIDEDASTRAARPTRPRAGRPRTTTFRSDDVSCSET